MPTLSIVELVYVLTGGTLTVWPMNDILVASLCVKYTILHKIGIANWFPSSHGFSVSIALATYLFQIGTDASVDAGLFIYFHH